MMGLDKMLSAAIGLTPDQMKAMVVGLTDTAAKALALIEKIDADNQLILEKLEGKKK